MPTKKTTDYKTLSGELDVVLGALQQPDIQVDEAMKLYAQGLKLVEELETHLKAAENELTRLKLQQENGA